MAYGLKTSSCDLLKAFFIVTKYWQFYAALVTEEYSFRLNKQVCPKYYLPKRVNKE